MAFSGHRRGEGSYTHCNASIPFHSFPWVALLGMEPTSEDVSMTLCPVALAAGCKKCPLVKLCPAKTIIGDYKKEESSSSS